MQPSPATPSALQPAPTTELTIDKQLTLLGAQADVDPVDGGRPGGESELTSQYPGAWALIEVAANGVTINGFEFEDGYNSIAVSWLTAPLQDLTISYNWIHSNQMWRGIVLNNNSSQNISNVLIDHNLITASANYPNQTSALIGMSGDTAIWSNITISNNACSNPVGKFLFAGGLPSGYLINTMSITGNIVYAGSFNLGNITNGEVTGNVFYQGGYIGIDNTDYPSSGISGNTFTNGAYLGLWGTDYGFTRPSKNLKISNNRFDTGSEFWPDGAQIDLSTIQVDSNRFVMPTGTPDPDQETGYLFYGPYPATLPYPTIDATYNWWGVSTGPTDGYFYGLTVITCPWIYSYTDDTAKNVPPVVLDWPLSTLSLTRAPGFWPIDVKQSNSLITAVSPAESGTLLCNGQPCATSYPCGTPVTITATAKPCNTFANWSGNCTGSGDCSVITGSAPISVTANFTIGSCNKPPVAQCKDVPVSAGSDCKAMADINNGSYDPDGDLITLLQSPAGPYNLGPSLVTLTVTDDKEASASCRGTVTVKDNTKPVITCPGDIVVFTDPGKCSAVVNYTVAATDNCPGAVTVTTIPKSGSVFQTGTKPVTATATDATGNTATCTFKVTVVQAVNLSRLVVSPSTVLGGNTSKGTVTLNGRAPTGGVQVTLTNANPAVATVPATVPVAAGSTTSALFPITTIPVAKDTGCKISATYNGVIVSATLKVMAADLSTLTLSPASVKGGESSTGTVTLNGAAPSGGTVVNLKSSNKAVATVPASVTVEAGKTSQTFVVSTSSLGRFPTFTTISASADGITKTAKLTVTVPKK